MTSREVSAPTLNERDDETHPAFGLIGAARMTSTPGAVLFDSDIRHGSIIRVTVSRATRKREIKQDWIHEDEDLIEVDLSEAQWASFVSTMNVGSGVPCTIRRTQDDYLVDGLPYDPRLAHSMREVHEAADEAFGKIAEAMAAYETVLDSKGGAKERREALSHLHHTIRNSTPNVDYAGKRLAEHAENVVQKARADIEAIVTYKAAQLGIEAPSMDVTPELEGPS